jgi:SAM-dependent methyltransferase
MESLGRPGFPMTTLLRRLVPPSLRLRARQLYYLPLEVRDRLLGRHEPLRPPRWLRIVGGGDFATVGARFLGHFRRLAGLRPDEAVLDVGCGVGRLALPLTGYLGRGGSYRGFDVVAAAVAWCRRHITPAFPQFRFRHADVYNAAYNPAGRLHAGDFVFPYADRSFDFVFLTSVFTHMRPAEVAHYLGQVARVLRPGGRCLATFFVLDAASRDLMTTPGSLFDFRHDAGGCFTTTPERPEAAVAYAEEDLRALVTGAGLSLREPIWYGGWCGRAGAPEGQDLVLAWKP